MADRGDIRLPCGATAFLAPAPTPRKGVVLLPSMPGTTAVFEEMALSLSEEHAWSVCVPEIITEEPGTGFAERRLKVRDVADEHVFSILSEAAAATGSEPVSLIGFCVGGMYAMKATSLHRFDRIVAFYGMVRIPTYWQSPTQGEPLHYLRGNTEGLLAIFGERDEFIPAGDIDAAEAAGVSTLRYPDAGHAFAHDEASAHFRAEDSADAWRCALEFLGVAPITQAGI
jgi:dienelactone hydrolase